MNFFAFLVVLYLTLIGLGVAFYTNNKHTGRPRRARGWLATTFLIAYGPLLLVLGSLFFSSSSSVSGATRPGQPSQAAIFAMIPTPG
jgi:RsiW-degrading membrane proteinase PrsW (M82 family)